MRGMIFKPESIKAIIEGRKTQTRRVEAGLKEINREPNAWYCSGFNTFQYYFVSRDTGEVTTIKARYQVGETVYIKEAWYADKRFDHLKPSDIPLYSCIGYPLRDIKPDWGGKLRSPMFLRQEFARIFRTITDVRAERVQEICYTDCANEGFGSHSALIPAKEQFIKYWNTLNKDYQWDSNPWVFPYTFRLKEGK